MKNLIATLALISTSNALASINYTNSIELPTNASQIKLTSAEYKLVPTKVEVKNIPGCVEVGENYGACTTEVVLESEGVIVANLSFQIPQAGEETLQSASVNLKVESFSPEAVTALKAASPAWKHPFSKVGTLFVKNNLTSSVKEITKEIQILDMSKSKLCERNESGDVLGNCSDVLVYKTAKTFAKEVTVLRK